MRYSEDDGQTISKQQFRRMGIHQLQISQACDLEDTTKLHPPFHLASLESKPLQPDVVGITL